jgi:hypothetical protein
MLNPWVDLPVEAPFVLAEDAPLLPRAMERRTDIMLDILPEPFVGNPETARVVFLLLNPGYVPEDLEINKDPYFVRQNRANLLHQAQPSFYYLDPRLSYSGGYIWWKKKLNGLVRAGFGLDELAEKIMCVEYLPYHSVNYKHSKQILPSQRYSFELVRRAVEQGKVIVMMRSERIWLEAVPELAGYDYIKLRNPQNTAISPGNMPPEAFDRLIAALA